METDVQAVLVQELVRNIESRAERRAFYQGRTCGVNGMAQGYDPHMWDAANLAKPSRGQRVQDDYCSLLG